MSPFILIITSYGRRIAESILNWKKIVYITIKEASKHHNISELETFITLGCGEVLTVQRLLSAINFS